MRRNTPAHPEPGDRHLIPLVCAIPEKYIFDFVDKDFVVIQERYLAIGCALNGSL
jgi:hypothetical protein